MFDSGFDLSSMNFGMGDMTGGMGNFGYSDPNAMMGMGMGMGNDWSGQMQQMLAGQIDQSQQMINQGMQNMNNIVHQAEHRAEQTVQQAMTQPNVKAGYQQYRAQGGMLSLHDYAYQYVATGGFSARGIANYQASENAAAAKVQNAWQGVRQAEQQSAAAIAQNQASYAANQNEAGNVMQGNATYVDNSGGQHTLPYLQQGMSYDQQSGNYYYLDAQGNYYMRTPSDTVWNHIKPRGR